MQLEGVIQNCVTYQNRVTSFRLESDPEIVYFSTEPLPATNGQFVRGETALDVPKPEDKKLRIKQLGIYTEKEGQLLHIYSPENFDF